MRANRDVPAPELALEPEPALAAPAVVTPPPRRPAVEVAPPPRPVERRPTYYFPTRVGTKWVHEWRAFGVRCGGYTEVVTGVRDGEPAKVVAVCRVEDDGAITPVGEFAVSDNRLERLATKDFAAELVFEYRGPPSQEDEIRGLKAMLDRNPTSRRTWVDGLENRVVVPAGTFTAITVHPASSARRESGSNLLLEFSTHSWYAPGVGLVRQAGGPYETALTSFTPGRE